MIGPPSAETVAEIEIVTRTLIQGELYLQGQVQLAIAADQRATTAASIFASMSTAVAAAFIAFWDSASDSAALVGGLVGAAFLLLAAGCAAWAARPVGFDIAGNHPDAWIKDWDGVFLDRLQRECASYQRRIAHNDLVMGENKDWIKSAFVFALLAPLFAVFAWACLR